MDLDLDGVEALDAVVRTGSFSAAARDLHKAQSAVSYAIKRLEDALGVAVFDRSGHRAVLTPVGIAVLDEGRFLLSRARRIVHLAGRFGEGWEARLHVVVDGALPMLPVLQALKALDQEGAPTHVHVEVAYLGGVQARFDTAGADLMLVKELTPAPWLTAVPLPEVELVLVAHQEHPAATVTQPHDVLSLQRHRELSVKDPRSDAVADNQDIGGAKVFYLSDFASKHQALRLGLGFGWMPVEVVAEDMASGRLVELAYVAGSRTRFVPRLVHRSDRPLGRAGLRLQALLQCGETTQSQSAHHAG